jgi:hypothetical protein
MLICLSRCLLAACTGRSSTAAAETNSEATRQTDTATTMVFSSESEGIARMRR